MSTITIEAYVPGRIKLTPTFLARNGAAELKWNQRRGMMTSQLGTATSTSLSSQLNDVGTVTVSLTIETASE